MFNRLLPFFFKIEPAARILCIVCAFMVTLNLILHSSSEPDPWWDSRYAYRQRITISNNNSGNVLKSGYSVKVSFDHTSVAETNGDDVRIVYWDLSNFKELDRVNESSWRISSANIWFKTQADIDSLNNDDHYYLYYSNSNAISPPESKSNIYLWYDDFSSDTLSSYSTGRLCEFYSDRTGVMTYNSGNLIFDADELVPGDGKKTVAGLLVTGISAANLLISCNVGISGNYNEHQTNNVKVQSAEALGLRWTAADSSYFAYIRNDSLGELPGITYAAEGDKDIIKAGDKNGIASGTITDRIVEGSGEHQIMYAISEEKHFLWLDKNDSASDNILSTNDSTLSNAGNPYFQVGAAKGWIDNLLVRNFNYPEPTTTLGSAEALNDYKIVALHPSTAGISPGEQNTLVLRLDLASSAGDNITQITVSGNNSLDTDISGVSCYYTGTSMSFETTAPFGISDNTLSNSNVIFSGSRILPDYKLVHFFISYNIAGNATSSANIDAFIKSNNIVISGNTYSANLSINPSGLRTISANADLGNISISNSITGNIVQGSSNQEILRIDIPVTGTGSALTLTSLTLTGNNTNSTDVDSLSCFYTSTSNTFSTNISFGTINKNFSNNEVTFTDSLDLDIADSTHYLFIAYNLNELAIDGATVDAQITGANITIEGTAQAPTNGDPTGNRIIYIPEGTINKLAPTAFELLSNPSLGRKLTVGNVSDANSDTYIDELASDDASYSDAKVDAKLNIDPLEFWTLFTWDLSSYSISGEDINSLSFDTEFYIDDSKGNNADINRVDTGIVQMYIPGTDTWENMGDPFLQTHAENWYLSDTGTSWLTPTALSYSKTTDWSDDYLNSSSQLKIRIYIKGSLTDGFKTESFVDYAWLSFNYGSIFQQTSFRWADTSEAPVSNENSSFTTSANQQIHLRTGLRITRKAKGTHYLALQYDTSSSFPNPIIITTSTDNIIMWNDPNHTEGDSVSGTKILSGSPVSGQYHEDNIPPSQNKNADTIYEEDFTVQATENGTYFLRVVEVDDSGIFSATLGSYTSTTKLIITPAVDTLSSYRWSLDSSTPTWSNSNVSLEFTPSTNYLLNVFISPISSTYDWQLQYQENPYTNPSSWTNVSTISERWSGNSAYAYSGAGNITGTGAFTANTNEGDLIYAIRSDANTRNNAYRFRVTNIGSSTGIDYEAYPLALNSTLEQVSYRWADDAESPLEIENYGGNIAINQQVHLRVGLRANHTTSSNYLALQVDGDNDGDFSTGTPYLLSTTSSANFWDDNDHTADISMSSTKLLSDSTGDGIYHEDNISPSLQTKTADLLYEEDFTISAAGAGNYYFRIVNVDSAGVFLTTLDTYSQNIALSVNTPSLTQTCFRWADDDSSLNFSSSDNNTKNFSIGVIHILAIQIENDSTNESPNWQLQYQKTNGTAGSWTNISVSSSHWKGANGIYAVDTDFISTGNFVCNNGNSSSGLNSEPGIYSESGSFNDSLDNNKYTEYWFALEATNNAQNNSYRFRLTDNGSTSSFNYATYATAAKQYSEQVSYRWADDTSAALYDENTSASVAVDANLHLRVGIRSNNGAWNNHNLALQAASDVSFSDAWLVTETSSNILMWNGGSEGIAVSGSKILSGSPSNGIYHTDENQPATQAKTADAIYEEDFAVSANVTGSFYIRVVSIGNTGINPSVLDVYSNTISLSASVPSLSQTAFRWGSGITASSNYFGAATSGNVDLEYTENNTYILAFRFDNLGVTSTANNNWIVQYQRDPNGTPGSWTSITTSSTDWKMVNSSTGNDQDVITVSQTGGNALLPKSVSSANNLDGVYGGSTDTGVKFIVNDKSFTEMWFAIEPQSSTSNASYRFRLTNSGSATGITYDKYGTASALIINNNTTVPIRGVIMFHGISL